MGEPTRPSAVFAYPRGGETFNVLDTVVFNWTSTFYRPELEFFAFSEGSTENKPIAWTTVYQNGTYANTYFKYISWRLSRVQRDSWPLIMQVSLRESGLNPRRYRDKGPRWTLISTQATPTIYAYSTTTPVAEATTKVPHPKLERVSGGYLPTHGVLQGASPTTKPAWLQNTGVSRSTAMPGSTHAGMPLSTPTSYQSGGSIPVNYSAPITPLHHGASAPGVTGVGVPGVASSPGGVEIGVGTGIGIACGILLLVGLYLWLRRRKQRRATGEASPEKLENGIQESEPTILTSRSGSTLVPSTPPTELAEESKPTELPYNSFIREAPDTSPIGTTAMPAELPVPDAVGAELSPDTAVASDFPPPPFNFDEKTCFNSDEKT